MTPFKLLLALASLTCFTSASNFKGDLKAVGADCVFPGDSAYGLASDAFNERFTFKPAAVAFPANPQQISRLVKIGAKYHHQVVARSGGHSYIANGLGGKNNVLVIDMRNMTQIYVDRKYETATIQTGNRLGDIALGLNKYGRGIPHGLCPYVGIGGHASFGGWGFTSRMWGLTLDTIQALDVVLVNGTIATLSKDSHPNLFWGMRGAGPSFAITTSITVKTYPEPKITTIYNYLWTMSPGAAAHAISSFQKFVTTHDIPKEYTAEIAFAQTKVVGQVSLTLTGGWYGASTNGLEALLAPYLATVPKPDKVHFQVGDYIDSIRYLGGIGRLSTKSIPDSPNTFYAKSLMTPEASPISEKALAALTNYFANDGVKTDLNWFVQFELYGGKNSVINSVPKDAAAFAHRSAMWTIQFYTSSPNFKPPFPDYGFTFLDGMVNRLTENSPKNWDIGAYPNYVDGRLENWQELYYGAHYGRLQGLKREYDPKNTFSFPQSIEL